MAKPISISLLLALSALALFVAGCGGSDDEATGSAGGETSIESGPPSKAEFTKEMEAVCTKSKATRYREAEAYRRKHEKELEAYEPIPREERIIRAIVLPSVLKEAKDLAALEPPAGEEKKIEVMIAEIEAGVKKAKKNPYSISLEVPSEYPFRKLGLKMRAYGNIACRNIA
jgi:hypothetical protein